MHVTTTHQHTTVNNSSSAGVGGLRRRSSTWSEPANAEPIASRVCPGETEGVALVVAAAASWEGCGWTRFKSSVSVGNVRARTYACTHTCTHVARAYVCTLRELPPATSILLDNMILETFTRVQMDTIHHRALRARARR
jgi:hypothetical protein